jgi:beta-glucosidase-like glycosyl hydrolase
MGVARVLFPAIRWDAARGFAPAAGEVDRALALGVGGFILFGGPAAEVAALTAALRARSGAPLLIGADLERGAGQQFDGAVSLPPAAALGALGDPEVTRRAGEVTGREARALGVDWVYAPVADLDVEPANPIVGTRAFGAGPGPVADHVAAWIDGCRAAGAMACVKHFPGHGRTVADSHLGLPVVDAARAALEADLRPFRAALARGVEGVMTAHVAYPALDAAGPPATLSRAIVTGLLRERLGFAGLVVTDALIMEGARGRDAAGVHPAVRALAAGCDVLLYPDDPVAVAAALEQARGAAPLEARLAEAAARIGALAGTLAASRTARRAGAGPGTADESGATAASREWGRAADRDWALDVATRTLRVVRGAPGLAGRDVDLVTVDDDAGGPFPPGPRAWFPDALTAAGIATREAASADPTRPAVVALYADIRGWKGRPHVSAAARARVARALAARPDATVVLFGHPRLAAEVPGDAALAAWGGDRIMQEAAGRWLAVRAR